MSAWIVTSAHISALVNAGIQQGLIDPKIGVDGLNAIGQDLWRENHRSINFNYGERNRTPRFHFRSTEASLDPGAVQMLARCYRYQSCERPDWEKSKACKFVEALIERCEADPRYVEFENYADGKTTMWGIERLSDVPTVDELPVPVEA